MMFVYQYYKITLIVIICCIVALVIYHKNYGNGGIHLMSPNVVKSKYENLYPISSESFAKLSKATYEAIRIEKIVETIDILQYDVAKPLPEESKQIECVIMKCSDPPYNVCLAAKDGFSQDIKNSGCWEKDIQDFIKQFFVENPTAMFFDLGMNIGIHSLYASVVNKNAHVLAVEPFPESVVTLHKSTHMNKVQGRFLVVLGAVTNKRGSTTAVGDFSGLMVKSAAEGTSKVIQVNTITMNDLTPLLKVKKALLKMDIEAQECHAFKNADKLFAEIDIMAIIMEIGPTRHEGAACFEGMLKFLSDRNYKGFYFSGHSDANVPLNFTNWQKWDFGVNVYFKKFY